MVVVIESNQSPSAPRADAKEKLLAKLDVDFLELDEVFEYLEEASKEGKMTIGGTNIEELVQMNEINSAHCGGDSYAKRVAVLQKAELANSRHINRYCLDRLEKLSKYCNEREAKQATDSVPTQDTIDYFRTLLKEYASFQQSSSPDETQDEYGFISEHLGDKRSILSDWQIQISSDQRFTYYESASTQKEKQLEKNCRILSKSSQDLETMNPPEGQAGDQFKSDLTVPEWAIAHKLCNYFLSNHRKYKIEETEGNLRRVRIDN